LSGKIDQAEAQEIMAKLKVAETEIKDLIKLAISSDRDASELEDLLDEIQELKLGMMDRMF